MPIQPPSLDDRSYADLVEELIARIPAHTPEWTNPVAGDPGRTLLELFAWLTDTLLYRANLIPERQRLAFLRLLGEPMRPALAARGLVTLVIDDDEHTDAVMLAAGATVKGPATFEMLREITVVPVTGEAYVKRPLSPEEQGPLRRVVSGLREVYRLSDDVMPYVTTPVFTNDTSDPAGVDFTEHTVDRCLWFALLAPSAELRDAVRQTLGGATPAGAPRVLSVGMAPRIAVPALFEDIGPRAEVPHVWELTGIDPRGEPRYMKLDVLPDADTTHGLTRRGVQRLVLPILDPAADVLPGAVRWIAAPSNDVRERLDAGVGDRPPRIDDEKKAARLVAWLRLRPLTRGVANARAQRSTTSLALSWAGLNAVEIDQRKTERGRVIGESNGQADQQLSLPGASVEPETLVLQVEEDGRGYVRWQRVDDLAFAGRDDAVFVLDAEAGTIRFGDGVRGRIPETGMRVRVEMLRAGGGAAGNLPVGSLAKVEGLRGPDGARVDVRMRAAQPLATEGGEDAETLEEAERRIPGLFRDRDRAVTEEDYRRLAATTPGVRLGRVDVMPRFKPQHRRPDVPGVVSVMVLPRRDGFAAPAPRPDRPMLEAVHAHLDARRPLATELYVISCEYVPLGIGAGISIRAGFGRDAVLQTVRAALNAFLWPLPPWGPEGTGWPRGRAVSDREIEVAVARVPGVSRVNGIALFRQQGDAWERMRVGACGPVTLDLEDWQLPELLSAVVLEADDAPEDLSGVPNPFAEPGVAVPVVPEVC